MKKNLLLLIVLVATISCSKTNKAPESGIALFDQQSSRDSKEFEIGYVYMNVDSNSRYFGHLGKKVYVYNIYFVEEGVKIASSNIFSDFNGFAVVEVELIYEKPNLFESTPILLPGTLPVIRSQKLESLPCVWIGEMRFEFGNQTKPRAQISGGTINIISADVDSIHIEFNLSTLSDEYKILGSYEGPIHQVRNRLK
ncbi:MAG: hypothetical protein JXR63_01345 [Spirochaetales bacterium]|nr:hypothetical protein [Spirochaetales bacterium]